MTLGAAVTALLITAVAAPAGASAVGWSCRASVASVDVAGVAHLEPIVAGSTGACGPGGSGFEDVTLGSPGGLASAAVRLPTARTDLENFGGPIKAQKPAATAGVASARITLLGGAIRIDADVLRSDLGAECAGDAPVPTGSSTVATLKLNGALITPDPLLEIVGNGTNGVPTGQLLRISVNKIVMDGTPTTQNQTFTRRALDIALIDLGDGNSLAHVVVGEARAGRVGLACQADKPDGPNIACRSSLATVKIPLVYAVEPVVANPGGFIGCFDEQSGLKPLSINALGLVQVDAHVAFANTQLLLGGGLSGLSGAADTALTDVTVKLLGAIKIHADVVRSRATVSCSGGSPVLHGNSRILDLTINGKSYPAVDGLLKLVGNGVNGVPAGLVLRIDVDDTNNLHSGPLDGVLRSALHIGVLAGGGKTGLIDVTLAGTYTGTLGNPCGVPGP